MLTLNLALRLRYSPATRICTLVIRHKTQFHPVYPPALTSRSRRFSSSPQSLAPEKSTTRVSGSPSSSNVIYEGPLTRTFRSLKIFSLSSLGLAAALTPFMFIIDTSLPFVARVVLASTAIGTSALSTALVSWCGHPYVATIRTLSDPDKANPPESIDCIQFETLTLTLRPRFTNVYDTAFLSETRRPFAKWELAEGITLGKANDAGPNAPTDETVAETMDAQGKVLGRWIVSWSEDGTKGTCRSQGKLQRFFNVHDEILPPLIR